MKARRKPGSQRSAHERVKPAVISARAVFVFCGSRKCSGSETKRLGAASCLQWKYKWLRGKKLTKHTGFPSAFIQPLYSRLSLSGCRWEDLCVFFFFFFTSQHFCLVALAIMSYAWCVCVPGPVYVPLILEFTSMLLLKGKLNSRVFKQEEK